MENIRVLCTAKKVSEISCISSFIELLKHSVGIQITGIKGTSLADYMDEDVDEEDTESCELFKARLSFEYQSKNCNMNIERISSGENRFIKFQIEYEESDVIGDLDNSVWYNFKEILIMKLYEKFEKIYWLEDSQNQKIATNLYERMYALENFLREIINSYMCIKHGGDWFEKYSYEDYVNKYLKFSEWFRKSRYELYKKVDTHLYNLEIDDIFEALKAAKRLQLTATVKKALEEIKKTGKSNDIAKTELLDSPSLWDEEKLGDVFSKSVVGRWETDLSKRRNMIAHNKMICRAMYKDTIKQLDFFEKEFRDTNDKLQRRIVSEEDMEIRRIQREYEIAMNLEYCDLDSSSLDEQDIIDQINEQDEIMSLSSIISDRITYMADRIDEVIGELNDAAESLNVDNFFEEKQFVGESLLQEYIEFAQEHPLYEVWKKLITTGITNEIYALIEPEILEYIFALISQLEDLKKSIFYIDLECLSEGDIIRIQDLDGNQYRVNLSGWLCVERGAINELDISLTKNESLIEYGGIYISYGDYEMTEDDIPIPIVEDEIVINIKDVNKAMEQIVDDIFDEFAKIEDSILNIEI